MPRSNFLKVWVVWMCFTVFVGVAGWIELLLGSTPILDSIFEGLVYGWVYGAPSSLLLSWFAVPLQGVLIYNMITAKRTSLDTRYAKKVTWILFLMSMFTIWIEPFIVPEFFQMIGRAFTRLASFLWVVDLIVTGIWIFLHFMVLGKIEEEFGR